MCIEVCREELSNQRQGLQWLPLYCLSVLNSSFIAGSTKMDLGPLDILPFQLAECEAFSLEDTEETSQGESCPSCSSVLAQLTPEVHVASAVPGLALEAQWDWLLQHLTAGSFHRAPFLQKRQLLQPSARFLHHGLLV